MERYGAFDLQRFGPLKLQSQIASIDPRAFFLINRHKALRFSNLRSNNTTFDNQALTTRNLLTLKLTQVPTRIPLFLYA
jgi:hypothetical protein